MVEYGKPECCYINSTKNMCSLNEIAQVVVVARAAHQWLCLLLCYVSMQKKERLPLVPLLFVISDVGTVVGGLPSKSRFELLPEGKMGRQG